MYRCAHLISTSTYCFFFCIQRTVVTIKSDIMVLVKMVKKTVPKDEGGITDLLNFVIFQFLIK